MWPFKPDVEITVKTTTFTTATEVLDAMDLLTDLIMTCRLDLVGTEEGSVTVKGPARRIAAFKAEFDSLHAKSLI